MALELRLVGRNILDADAEFVASRPDDAVDQQERIAMWQETQQPLDFVAFYGFTHRRVHSNPPSIPVPSLRRGALLSQRSPKDASKANCPPLAQTRAKRRKL